MKNPSGAICGAKHGNKWAVWEVDKKLQVKGVGANLVLDFIRAEDDVVGLGRVHAEVHGTLLAVERETPEVKSAAVLHVHLVHHDQRVFHAQVNFL